MADNQVKIKDATDLINQAIAADRAGNTADALNFYDKGLQLWVHIIKFHPKPDSLTAIHPRLQEYVVRAEELRELVRKPQTQAALSGGGSDEKKGLHAAMEGAILKEKPNVKWDDVAGLENAKQTLRETVILPVRFPQLFVGNIKPWKGILLYGPPGTGKSYLAKACATEADATFFSVSSSSLVSKWMGESEQLVKTLFEMARAETRAIIFIDEVDSLCGSRGNGESEASRRIKTEFLVQMDGVGAVGGSVLVLGATNCPWDLDPAIRRRFERRIYIPLPEIEARRRMIELSIGSTPNQLTPVHLGLLATKTEGFSGADIAVFVRDALLQPIRRCSTATHFKRVGKFWTPCKPDDPDKTVEKRSLMTIPSDELRAPTGSWEDFESAIANARSSVGNADLTRQEEWTTMFGMEG